MQDILGSLPAVLKAIDPDGTAVEPIVFAAWARCVDGALAENIVPMRLEKNRLIVAVPGETWRRNVADLGPALAAKLNAAVGSRVVDYIEFQVNAAVLRDHRRRSKETGSLAIEQATATDRIAESLQPAAASIEDENLRERFVNAAASSLARMEVRRS